MADDYNDNKPHSRSNKNVIIYEKKSHSKDKGDWNDRGDRGDRGERGDRGDRGDRSDKQRYNKPRRKGSNSGQYSKGSQKYQDSQSGGSDSAYERKEDHHGQQQSQSHQGSQQNQQQQQQQSFSSTNSSPSMKQTTQYIAASSIAPEKQKKSFISLFQKVPLPHDLEDLVVDHTKYFVKESLEPENFIKEEPPKNPNDKIYLQKGNGDKPSGKSNQGYSQSSGGSGQSGNQGPQETYVPKNSRQIGSDDGGHGESRFHNHGHGHNQQQQSQGQYNNNHNDLDNEDDQYHPEWLDYDEKSQPFEFKQLDLTSVKNKIAKSGPSDKQRSGEGSYHQKEYIPGEDQSKEQKLREKEEFMKMRELTSKGLSQQLQPNELQQQKGQIYQQGDGNSKVESEEESFADIDKKLENQFKKMPKIVEIDDEEPISDSNLEALEDDAKKQMVEKDSKTMQMRSIKGAEKSRVLGYMQQQEQPPQQQQQQLQQQQVDQKAQTSASVLQKMQQLEHQTALQQQYQQQQMQAQSQAQSQPQSQAQSQQTQTQQLLQQQQQQMNQTAQLQQQQQPQQQPMNQQQQMQYQQQQQQLLLEQQQQQQLKFQVKQQQQMQEQQQKLQAIAQPFSYTSLCYHITVQEPIWYLQDCQQYFNSIQMDYFYKNNQLASTTMLYLTVFNSYFTLAEMLEKIPKLVQYVMQGSQTNNNMFPDGTSTGSSNNIDAMNMQTTGITGMHNTPQNIPQQQEVPNSNNSPQYSSQPSQPSQAQQQPQTQPGQGANLAINMELSNQIKQLLNIQQSQNLLQQQQQQQQPQSPQQSPTDPSILTHQQLPQQMIMQQMAQGPYMPSQQQQQMQQQQQQQQYKMPGYQAQFNYMNTMKQPQMQQQMGLLQGSLQSQHQQPNSGYQNYNTPGQGQRVLQPFSQTLTQQMQYYQYCQYQQMMMMQQQQQQQPPYSKNQGMKGGYMHKQMQLPIPPPRQSQDYQQRRRQEEDQMLQQQYQMQQNPHLYNQQGQHQQPYGGSNNTRARVYQPLPNQLDGNVPSSANYSRYECSDAAQGTGNASTSSNNNANQKKLNQSNNEL